MRRTPGQVPERMVRLTVPLRLSTAERLREIATRHGRTVISHAQWLLIREVDANPEPQERRP